MTTLKHISTILIVALLISCNNKNHGRKNTINRIVFATGGCLEACPVLSIDIDSTLNFKYHGIKYTDKPGFHFGNVTNGFWDTLNMKFEHINYRELDTTYNNSVDDLATEIFIYYDDKVKHIYGQSGSLPDSVMTVYDWFLKSIRNFKLVPTSDSLTFPTTVGKPPPPPPLEQVEFVPPTIDSK